MKANRESDENIGELTAWQIEADKIQTGFDSYATISVSMFTYLMNLAGRFVEENRHAYNWEENADAVLNVADMMLRIIELLYPK